jgi:hypothetical protein
MEEGTLRRGRRFHQDGHHEQLLFCEESTCTVQGVDTIEILGKESVLHSCEALLVHFQGGTSRYHQQRDDTRGFLQVRKLLRERHKERFVQGHRRQQVLVKDDSTGSNVLMSGTNVEKAHFEEMVETVFKLLRRPLVMIAI